jgi:hypothetical protein
MTPVYKGDLVCGNTNTTPGPRRNEGGVSSLVVDKSSFAMLYLLPPLCFQSEPKRTFPREDAR